MKLLLLTLVGICVGVQGESELLQNFVIGSNKFAADVYREWLKTKTGNFLVCPLSAETILALTHAGAGGQTAQQLTTALHLPESKEQIQHIIRELTPHLKGNEHYSLSSANKIYIKDGYEIQDQFKNIAVNVFDSDIQNIDFEKKEDAANEMNKWVEGKTDNKIKNLINPDSLTKDTVSILINAMYFHGKWATPFNKDRTQKQDFYYNKQEKIQTDMMEQTRRVKYFESSELNAKFLELPYAGEDITMTFVLPNEKEGLSVLEEHLNDVFVAPKYYTPKVHAVIPKFKIESTIDFKPILQALGVKDAFENNAEITEILIGEPMKISKVLQKAFIEVEEEGTTAAAATYVEGVTLYSLNTRPDPIIPFIADHPFIFFIKIKDLVFFAGRYTSPK